MSPILFRLLFAVLFIFCIKISFASPITGNPNGNVTLIEYFDYECPHCRRMEPVIESLQAEYPNLRVIHRVTPLLTPVSRGIASVALAAQAQSQAIWLRIHEALMQMNSTPTLNDVETIALGVGLSHQALLSAPQDKRLQQQINQNIQLASHHAINGGLYLPIMVFGQSNSNGQPIVLTGEQPRALLSAIVRQLGDQDKKNVQLVQKQKRQKSRKHSSER